MDTVRDNPTWLPDWNLTGNNCSIVTLSRSLRYHLPISMMFILTTMITLHIAACDFPLQHSLDARYYIASTLASAAFVKSLQHFVFFLLKRSTLISIVFATICAVLNVLTAHCVALPSQILTSAVTQAFRQKVGAKVTVWRTASAPKVGRFERACCRGPQMAR